MQAMRAMIDASQRKQIGNAKDAQLSAIVSPPIKKPTPHPKKSVSSKFDSMDYAKKEKSSRRKKDSSQTKDKEKEKESNRRSSFSADSNAAPPSFEEAKLAPPEDIASVVADIAPTEGGSAAAEGTASTQFLAAGGAEGAVDLTRLPGLLDERFEALDQDRALHATILNVGTAWQKKTQPSLLSPPVDKGLGAAEQRLEKQACWDLLDALSKSGCLGVEGASLHVVLASSHVFDLSVMDTLVQRNANPIERVQNSQLIIAATVHNKPVSELLKNPAEVAAVAPPAILALKG